jgi:hypothetical protein
VNETNPTQVELDMLNETRDRLYGVMRCLRDGMFCGDEALCVAESIRFVETVMAETHARIAQLQEAK